MTRRILTLLLLLLLSTAVPAFAWTPCERRAFLSSSTVAFWVGTANAYETREVGGADRSAVTAAMNRQAIETNNRLEKSGFKLDTREEESARLSQAMSSFKYESSTPKKSGAWATKPTETSTTKSK